MNDEGIEAVRQLLASKPRPASLAERRARLDAVAAADPLPADVEFEAAQLGGVSCEWSRATGSDAARLLVYFHGGGYCSGSIVSHRGMVARAGIAAGVRTLAVGYRLAPENPYPAALQDALAVYDELLAQGIAPNNVVIGGDSAGGNLTLTLMLSLREAGKPLPACGWLVSPWVDLAMTGESLTTKASIDPLISKPYLDELASAFLAGADPRQPLISPLYADLRGLPPLLVQVGSAETLLDDAVRVAARAGSFDVPVTLEIWPHMIHAWHLWAAQLDEGRQALETAGAFMRAHLG